MDEKIFKDLATRLRKVNDVIKELDSSLRNEAFTILRPYVMGSPIHDAETQRHKKHSETAGLDAETFFSQHSGKKPADNAILVAAFMYGEYGSESFSIEDVRELADEVGVTIPDRLDMTFLAAKRDGKSLFRRAGKKRFKPTVHGESNFKSAYQLNKGRKKRAEGAGA